jgi:hypothetical protein
MQGYRSGQREVEHTSFREWTTVIHDHNDAALRSWLRWAAVNFFGSYVSPQAVRPE